MPMSVVDEVSKLHFRHVLVALAFILAFLGPGLLTIYLFKPSLVIGLDFVKLVLFSASLDVPVFTVNALLMPLMESALRKELEDKYEQSAVLLVLWTSFAFYAALLVSYLLRSPFRHFLLYLLVLDFIGLLIVGNIFRTSGNPISRR
jgi:uncharacterized protein YacL